MAVGCFLLLGFTNGNVPEVAPYWVQFLLLYGGIALLIWGLSGGDLIANALFNWRELPRQELFVISGILMLALVLRLWELGSKIRVPVDEVLPMTEIMTLWDNPHLPMISQFGLISSLTRVFASWQAASVAVFGHNLLALRIPSAIVGTLTVGAVYFLGRVLFDRKTAVIGAVILATYPPHLQFSRIGIMSIADPLFGTLAFAFIWLGFKNNWRLAWVLGGVCLGLTQYFYEGGRLLFPAFIVIWVMVKLLFNRKAIRSWTRGLLICAVTAGVIAAPIYYTLARLNNPLSTRMDTLALSRNDWLALLTSPPSSPTFDFLVRHTIDPLLLFINRPDSTPYYGGSTALILVFLVPVFVVGLLWSIRNPNGRGLVLWFLVTWAGNVLLVDSALVTHYVMVFPAVALITAVGVMRITAYLPNPYRLKVVFVYVALCAVVQTVYYFGPHLDAYNQQLVQGRDAYDALFRAADLPSGTSVYMINPPATITETFAQDLLRFLADDKTFHVIDKPTEYDFSQMPVSSSSAFFVPSDDTTTVQILTRYFDLQAPEYSSYPLTKEQAYTLYLAVAKTEK
jgi:hypothetical protein